MKPTDHQALRSLVVPSLKVHLLQRSAHVSAGSAHYILAPKRGWNADEGTRDLHSQHNHTAMEIAPLEISQAAWPRDSFREAQLPCDITSRTKSLHRSRVSAPHAPGQKKGSGQRSRVGGSLMIRCELAVASIQSDGARKKVRSALTPAPSASSASSTPSIRDRTTSEPLGATAPASSLGNF